jgi:light-regulated signal transduction histidine kinase (bacteriophytochrome)
MPISHSGLILVNAMTQATPDSIDLSNCDKEPIRTPGSIQPHGFLLVLSSGMAVLQASANLAGLAGCDAQQAIGRPLAEVIGPDAARRLEPELDGARLGPRPLYVGTITAANGRHFDVLAHAWDGVVIAEFEQVERAGPADFRHLYPLIGEFLHKVNDAGSIESLAQQACQHVRAVTGFGRVSCTRCRASA